jgi:hypothetical protein
VRFRHELLIEVLTEDPNIGTESHYFSTIKDINVLSMNELGTPLIRASTQDFNADGKMDRLDLHIEIKSLIGRSLKIGESIRNVKVYGSLDYQMRSMVKMEMIGFFSINVQTPSGACRVRSYGELSMI